MLQPALDAFADALALDLAKWPNATTRSAPDGLHAILAIHGSKPVRLVIQAGVPTGAPLAAVVPLDNDTSTRLAAIQRLGNSLRPPRPYLERDPITSMRRGRLVFMLRALDGRIAGATHRAIAEILFRLPAMPAREWKAHSTRSKTLRLVAEAMALTRGGYFTLLRSGSR